MDSKSPSNVEVVHMPAPEMMRTKLPISLHGWALWISNKTKRKLYKFCKIGDDLNG